MKTARGWREDGNRVRVVGKVGGRTLSRAAGTVHQTQRASATLLGTARTGDEAPPTLPHGCASQRARCRAAVFLDVSKRLSDWPSVKASHVASIHAKPKFSRVVLYIRIAGHCPRPSEYSSSPAACIVEISTVGRTRSSHARCVGSASTALGRSEGASARHSWGISPPAGGGGGGVWPASVWL